MGLCQRRLEPVECQEPSFSPFPSLWFGDPRRNLHHPFRCLRHFHPVEGEPEDQYYVHLIVGEQAEVEGYSNTYRYFHDNAEKFRISMLDLWARLLEKWAKSHRRFPATMFRCG